MTRLAGYGLLASAFAPLAILIAVLRLPQLGWSGWTIILVSVFAVLFLIVVLRSVARIQSRSIETASVRRADERVLGFAASYVVPSIVALFGGTGATSTVATCALAALLALIYVRGELYHLNPTLAALGFRLYEVTLENGTATMLLTRTAHLPQRGELECRYLSPSVAIQLER